MHGKTMLIWFLFKFIFLTEQEKKAKKIKEKYWAHPSNSYIPLMNINIGVK